MKQPALSEKTEALSEKTKRIYSLFTKEIDEIIKAERERIMKEIWSDTFLTDEDKARLSKKIEIDNKCIHRINGICENDDEECPNDFKCTEYEEKSKNKMRG